MRDGWIETTLSEVAEFEMGRTPSRRIDAYWTSDLSNPFCTIADMDEKLIEPKKEGVTTKAITEGKAKLAKQGTLLMSFKLTIGKLGFAKRDLFPNEAILMIYPNTKKTSKDFLYIYLGSKDLSKGSGRAVKGSTLNSKSLAALEVTLPPLPEQKRIVDLISSVDSYIESLEKQLATGKSARNAILYELLSTPGPDWIKTTLGEVAEVIMGQSPNGKTYNLVGDGIPFMQGSAEFRQHNPIPEKWCSEPKKIAEHGDLLLSVRAPVGDTNFADQRIAIGRGLSIIRATKKSSNVFIRFVIQLNVARLIESSGSGMFASITGKNLREFTILLPPLREQKRIVEIISEFDSFIENVEKTIEEGKKLRSGLLSELLSGEHEIPASYDKVMSVA